MTWKRIIEVLAITGPLVMSAGSAILFFMFFLGYEVTLLEHNRLIAGLEFIIALFSTIIMAMAMIRYIQKQ